MKRQVTMEEISDGRLYTANDMVRADCGGCEGCSACCRGMGQSLILDPLDADRLAKGLERPFSDFLEKEVELNVVDGVILPNMRMAGEGEGCAFLNSEGRCRVHAWRPGICRMFPLGRYYEGRDFRYFLQVHECAKPNRSKVKVKNWLDTPNLKAYEVFVRDWHGFLKDLEEALKADPDPSYARNMNLYMLNLFYMRPFRDAFYEEFSERLAQARDELGL